MKSAITVKPKIPVLKSIEVLIVCLFVNNKKIYTYKNNLNIIIDN